MRIVRHSHRSLSPRTGSVRRASRVAEAVRRGRCATAGSGAGNLAIQRYLRGAGGAFSSGRPLPHATRRFMEARFGADFGRVRLHTGGDSERAARAIDARAFTYGPDIFLGPGRNDFSSAAERRLLAHELTHVIQQTGTGERRARHPDAPRISRAPLSLQRYSWEEFKKDAGDVASSVVSGVSNVAGSVASAAAPIVSAVAPVVSAAAPVVSAAAAPLVRATQQALSAADVLANLQRIQVDWNSPAGMTLRAWAARLDPDTARKARAAGAGGVLSVLSVPDEVQEAAAELGRNARMDVTPAEPPPVVDPTVKPLIRPTPRPLPPGPLPLPPPLVVAILVFLAILLWPSTTPEKAETDPLKKAEEQRKQEAEEKKKKREEERGRCRETIPPLRGAIHATVLSRLDGNAENFLAERLGDTPRTPDELGRFFNANKFFFFLAIVRQTKNTILKVCSVSNNTLAENAGNKDIGTTLHAEEIAAPGIRVQLTPVPLKERAGATLFNVCQSRACAENARNPDGCTAVLEQVVSSQLPGGEVVDEPTGFPKDIQPQSEQALERALRKKLPNP